MRVIVPVCVSVCVPPLSVRVQSNVASKRRSLCTFYVRLNILRTARWMHNRYGTCAPATRCTVYMGIATRCFLECLPACLICCRLPRLWQVAGRQGSKGWKGWGELNGQTRLQLRWESCVKNQYLRALPRCCCWCFLGKELTISIGHH